MHGHAASATTGPAARRDWTQGRILPNLLSLSWPIMLGNSLNQLGPTIDMIWVGRLGPAAIAGVGIAGMVDMLVNSIMWGSVIGLRAIIARYVGARDEKGAALVAAQAYVIAFIYAALVALAGILFAEPIMRLLGVSSDVVAQGAAYLRIVFIGAIAMTIRLVTEGIMQASGDAVTPLKISALLRLVHVGLSPVLIFGWWLFPSMGVAGAALASVIASVVGASVGLWFLLSGRSHLRFTAKHFEVSGAIIRQIIRIAIPACITAAERTLGQLTLMRIVAPFGTLAVAAHTVNQRVEMFVLMPVMGLSVGASVLVGQNLGAGRADRAERSGWTAVGVAEVLMAVSAAAVLIWADGIVRIFTQDSALVATGADFLRIAAAGYLLMGIGGLMGQAISGAGDTVTPMLITLLGMWAIQIPLAILLPRFTDLGVYGVRWSIVLGSAIAATVYLVYFKTGRWKRKQV